MRQYKAAIDPAPLKGQPIMEAAAAAAQQSSSDRWDFMVSLGLAAVAYAAGGLSVVAAGMCP